MQPITEAEVWEYNSHAANQGYQFVRVQLTWRKSRIRICKSTIHMHKIKEADVWEYNLLVANHIFGFCESTTHMQPITEADMWEYNSHAAYQGSDFVRVQLTCSQSRKRICESTTHM